MFRSNRTFCFSRNQTTYSVAFLVTAWLVIVEDFVLIYSVVFSPRRCGYEKPGLILLLTSSHFCDEEEDEALLCGLPYTITQSFIHARDQSYRQIVCRSSVVSAFTSSKDSDLVPSSQGSSTSGPPASFVRPRKGISQNTVRYEYWSLNH